jgi:3',5'-cyclic AMP phosphodiesterase CpdA
MSELISWVHISDLHIRAGDNYDQRVVLDSLLEDVAGFREAAPDLIFITGDLVYSGRAEEYVAAAAFVRSLSSATSVPLDRVFCVPGNHDVDRACITPFLRNAARALRSRDLIAQLLGSPSEVRLFTRRHQAYTEFVRATFPWASLLSEDDLWYAVSVCVNDLRLGVLGLNSSWAGGLDSDRGHLTIGERQVRSALKAVGTKDLLLALFHHPLAWLSDADAADVQNLLNGRCDFVLHGHLHQLGVINIASPDSEVYYLAAGAVYDGRTELLAYNTVTLDLHEGSAAVRLRRYSDRTGGLWGPDTLMYRSAPDGVLHLELPERIAHKPRIVTVPSILSRIEALSPPAVLAEPPSARKTVPEAPPVPEALIRAVRSRQCILFVGAGASRDAKLPDWREMTEELLEHARSVGAVTEADNSEVKHLTTDGQYLVVADFLRHRLGPHDFAQYFQKRLTDANRESRTHRLLAGIPFRAAISTNFDPFIEHSRKNCRVVLPELMASEGAVGVQQILADPNVFPVVKIHGSYDDGRSILLTHGDFQRVLFANKPYRDFLSRLFTECTIFFYGYSFRDPNVDAVLQELMAVYHGASVPHYALIADAGPIFADHIWRNYNVRVISYPAWQSSHVLATEFLSALAQSTTS